jgi:hypothetical protein
MLLDYPHSPLKTSNARTKWLRKRYRAFRKKYGSLKPLRYDGRERWTALPAEFQPSRNVDWV